MAASNLKVSLEALAENNIQEIAYDGTERITQPLHLSESLTKLSQLIDFTEDGVEKKAPDGPDKQKQKAELKQPKPWPWDWLRSSLMSSLTELNVLSDCLSIAKDKKVMMLNQIQPRNDHSEARSAYQLFSRKQALQNAAEIFNKGAERIKKNYQESVEKLSKSSEFYSQLWALRQNWRIKKVGQNILGDLSYKSAGSTFWQNGTFEVFKRSNEKAGLSAIDVRVPPELEGSAYIQVSIHMTTSDDSVSKLNSMLTLPQRLPTSPNETAKWQFKLETAQNVLFCKEIFSQISREAFKLNSSISHMVINNQVIVSLFPDFKMHIMFCHSDTSDTEAEAVAPVADQSLQIALYQLLRGQHYNSLHREPPHPVTASIGPSKRRRIAGPSATRTSDLLAMQPLEHENILERMIDISRHVVLRLRTIEIVEHLSLTISDPSIHVHTDGLSSETNTSLKVTITSPSYDLIKSSFALNIRKGKVFALGRSGHEVDLDHEAQRLEDYVMWQVTQYQVYAVYTLATMMGCKVLSYSHSSISANREIFGTNPSLLVSSPDGSRALSVRGNTVSGIEVFVSQSGASFSHITDLVTDHQWKLLRGSFKPVRITRMPGRNFTHKMELLLSVYGRQLDT